MEQHKITLPQLQILSAIDGYKRGFLGGILNPRIRDIAIQIKRSPATVQQHINILLKNKYLKKQRQGVYPRNYILTMKAREVLGAIK